MEITDAKRWVRRDFKAMDTAEEIETPEDLYPAVDALYGCVDPLTNALRKTYPRAHTYHDLWFEVHTDRVIESGAYDESRWVDELYPIYVKDLAVRGGGPPAPEGFRAWLATVVGPAGADEVLQRRHLGKRRTASQTASQHCLRWCGMKPTRGSRVTLHR